jgi:hypothetical protein
VHGQGLSVPYLPDERRGRSSGRRRYLGPERRTVAVTELAGMGGTLCHGKYAVAEST